MAKQISQKEYQKRATDLLGKLQREVSPFEEVGKAATARRKKRARSDLLYFCKTYLPHHFDQPFEAGHEQMAGALHEMDKIIQWRGFRGTGKTTLGITGYGLQAVLFKQTHYLPVISDTTGQAEMLMLPMKIELENNERIKHDFGEQAGVNWSNDELVTRENVKVEAHSWRSFKRGRKHMQWRSTLVIGDDWESLESVRNKTNIDNREDALLGDVLNALDLKKPWQILMITNKLGRGDLGDRLKANKRVVSVDIPAREDGKLDGDPTHSQTFSDKVLKNILATIGMVRFCREYLMKIVSSEHDDFQETWFTYIKKPAEKRRLRVTALDPSVGSTEGHDTKAIVTVDLTDSLEHFDVVHAWIRHDTINAMCEALFNVNTKWQPDEVVVESNGFQVLIKNELKRLAMNDAARMDLLTKIFQMQNNVRKNTRIMRTQTLVENGSLRYMRPSGDVRELINQKLEFKSDRTDNTDDGPDAEEMAVRRLKEKAGMSSNEVQAQVII